MVYTVYLSSVVHKGSVPIECIYMFRLCTFFFMFANVQVVDRHLVHSGLDSWPIVSGDMYGFVDHLIQPGLSVQTILE